MTVDEYYKYFAKQLKTIYEDREATNIADWVFESIANCKRLDRVAHKQQAISNAMIEHLNNALQQLLQHRPVQYVLGEAWFYKMKFFVNENVLIPRPETEELVEWVVEKVRGAMYDIQNKNDYSIGNLTSHIAHVLDIGTGSGCIAIAVKKELPHAEIFAVDVSEEALHVARQNAKGTNVHIKFIQLDFLNENYWAALPSFNIIVSNPPYIPENEKNQLAKNVVSHEPHLALFVPDEDPFIFYKKMAMFAGSHLKENGKIFAEVHEDYAKKVQQIFAEKDFKTKIKKDIYERERMICAYR